MRTVEEKADGGAGEGEKKGGRIAGVGGRGQGWGRPGAAGRISTAAVHRHRLRDG